MIPTVTLLVDPHGWPAPLDPEMVNSVLHARLLPQLPVEVRALTADDHWFQALPQDSALIFVLLTRPLASGWRNVVANWLGPTHTLYALYLDSVDPGDIRALANLTASQLVARAPYRIVQHNAIGLENAMQWK